MRGLLLRAGSYRTGPATPVVTGGSDAAASADRRAIASLRRAGLIVVRPGERFSLAHDFGNAIRGGNDDLRMMQLAVALRRKEFFIPRFLFRTALGQEVVERWTHELETGKAIRWDARLEDARDAIIAGCPHFGDYP